MANNIAEEMATAHKLLRPYKISPLKYRSPRTYFDLAINKEPLGRVIFELKAERLPITCANFMALCQGICFKPDGTVWQENERNRLHYKGTSLFRIMGDFCVCGGDVMNDNGTSGYSVYDKATFDEEKGRLSHDSPGILSMLQQAGGPNTIGSQFFITLKATPWLDQTNVAFGRVVSGLDVVKRVVRVYGQEDGSPRNTVRICDSGIV